MNRKMLAMFVMLMGLLLVACNKPTATPTKAYAESTQTQIASNPVMTRQALPTNTPEATKTPVPTVEPRYAFTLTVETSEEEYGEFSISWELHLDPTGGTYDEVVQTAVDARKMVYDACPWNNTGWVSRPDTGYVYIFIDNHFSNAREPLSTDCWAAIEEATGMYFKHNDPNFGAPRPVGVVDGTTLQVPLPIVRASDLYEDKMIVEHNGTYYTAFTTWTRVEPNFFDYPGQGDLKYDFPTSVTIPLNSALPELGISNWGGKTLCYNEVGNAGRGEMWSPLPGNTQNCVTVENFVNTKDGYNQYRSWAWTGKDEFMNFMWVPVYNADKTVTLNIIDVAITRLQKRENNEAPALIKDGVGYNENAIDIRMMDLEVGTAFDVVGVKSYYSAVECYDTTWHAFEWIGTELQLQKTNTAQIFWVEYGTLEMEWQDSDGQYQYVWDLKNLLNHTIFFYDPADPRYDWDEAQFRLAEGDMMTHAVAPEWQPIKK